jgi:elongation factor P|tara:strand:- start:1331 stop:1918 length:588 start_codon:yes stop_codon:yes gene_type:complete
MFTGESNLKVNGNTIKPGNVIEHKNGLWVATKTSHVKPGKGGAFAQIELKSLKDGSKLNERFRSSENVEKVILEETPYVFLYKENDSLIFMNNQTFEQISVNIDMIGDQAAFLQDGMNVIINIYNENPVSIIMPDNCIEEIVEADAVIKGQTVSSSFKPAILKNGVKVMVPGHIEVGTKIVVRPSDCTYVEKAKT